MKTTAHILLAMLLMAFPLLAQLEGPPSLIDYQGRLLNNLGGPITGAGGPGTTGTATNYEIRFRIWDAQTGGSLIWAEKQVVTVTGDGLFSVRLGEGEAITADDLAGPTANTGSVVHAPSALLSTFDGSDRFLGVTVVTTAGDPSTAGEIVPRLAFLASPFALVAEKARYAEFGPSGGSFSSDAIGIGTASPGGPFEIDLTDRSLLYSSAGALTLSNPGGAPNSSSISLGVASSSPALTATTPGGTNSHIYFTDQGAVINPGGGTGFVMVENGGNMGINTINPTHSMEIRGNPPTLALKSSAENVDSSIALKELTDTQGFDIHYDGDNTNRLSIRRYNDSATPATALSISRSTGNVGIGTDNPKYPLHIQYDGSTEQVVLGLGDADSNEGTNPLLYVSTDKTEDKIQFNSRRSDDFTFFSYTGANGGGSPHELMRIEAESGNVGIGTTSPSHLLHVNGIARSTQSNFATSSDLRAKENIATVVPNRSLQRLLTIRPVTFDYTEEYRSNHSHSDGRFTGFIAQEVEAVFPEMVTTVEEQVGNSVIEDFRTLNISDMLPHVVAAIQEIESAAKAEVARKNQKISLLETRLAALEARDKAREATFVRLEKLLEAQSVKVSTAVSSTR